MNFEDDIRAAFGAKANEFENRKRPVEASSDETQAKPLSTDEPPAIAERVQTPSISRPAHVVSAQRRRSLVTSGIAASIVLGALIWLGVAGFGSNDNQVLVADGSNEPATTTSSTAEGDSTSETPRSGNADGAGSGNATDSGGSGSGAPIPTTEPIISATAGVTNTDDATAPQSSPTPTPTPTSSPSPEPTPTQAAQSVPVPTQQVEPTGSVEPTATPATVDPTISVEPTAVPATPSSTPVPTATQTPPPSATATTAPSPTATATPVPTSTPPPTATPVSLAPSPRVPTYTDVVTVEGAGFVTLYSAPNGPEFTPQANGVNFPVTNPDYFGQPIVFRVIEGTASDGWIRVQVQGTPNGMTAWIENTELSWSSSNYLIQADVSASTLTIFSGNDVLATTPMRHGQSGRPTPQGDGWIQSVVPFQGSSRPYQIVTGFVVPGLNSGGAIPVVNLTNLVGGEEVGPVNNGGIAVSQEVIDIARTLPLGTRIHIHS